MVGERGGGLQSLESVGVWERFMKDVGIVCEILVVGGTGWDLQVRAGARILDSMGLAQGSLLNVKGGICSGGGGDVGIGIRYLLSAGVEIGRWVRTS